MLVDRLNSRFHHHPSDVGSQQALPTSWKKRAQRVIAHVEGRCGIDDVEGKREATRLDQIISRLIDSGREKWVHTRVPPNWPPAGYFRGIWRMNRHSSSGELAVAERITDCELLNKSRQNVPNCVEVGASGEEGVTPNPRQLADSNRPRANYCSGCRPAASSSWFEPWRLCICVAGPACNRPPPFGREETILPGRPRSGPASSLLFTSPRPEPQTEPEPETELDPAPSVRFHAGAQLSGLGSNCHSAANPTMWRPIEGESQDWPSLGGSDA
ncbi:unnamed protein product [Protopolystoma xenopodis]|uniref:Uncharacterized protein n=1 Tax=Protopolystoma xenopodis TaxID=117903 RepID=A0A3S5BDV5_9PLAT|nr:unnamed protein product [Protopolystoma xenopodis]